MHDLHFVFFFAQCINDILSTLGTCERIVRKNTAVILLHFLILPIGCMYCSLSRIASICTPKGTNFDSKILLSDSHIVQHRAWHQAVYRKIWSNLLRGEEKGLICCSRLAEKDQMMRWLNALVGLHLKRNNNKKKMWSCVLSCEEEAQICWSSRYCNTLTGSITPLQMRPCWTTLGVIGKSKSSQGAWMFQIVMCVGWWIAVGLGWALIYQIVECIGRSSEVDSTFRF